MNPLLLILAKLLEGSIDWRKILKEQGEAVLRRELTRLWTAKLTRATPRIAAAMERDGWTWSGSAGKDVPDEGLGRGFVLSRDALYRLLKATGVPGGAVRDGWRDSADNAVFELIRPQVVPGMSIEELVRLTAVALVDHTL